MGERPAKSSPKGGVRAWVPLSFLPPSAMDADTPTHFNAIVVGTGLSESILAAHALPAAAHQPQLNPLAALSRKQATRSSNSTKSPTTAPPAPLSPSPNSSPGPPSPPPPRPTRLPPPPSSRSVTALPSPYVRRSCWRAERR